LRDRNLPLSLLLGIEANKGLVTAQSKGTLLDNIQPMSQLRARLNKHTSHVFIVAFKPDGRTLASGTWDHAIILLDLERRQPIGQSLTGHSDYVTSVAFSPDGKTLASGGGDKTVILWDVEARSWIEKSCLRANRNLTRAGWTRYIGDARPYPAKQEDAACPNFPIEEEASTTPTSTS
jgi:WD40 repeat protein